MRNYTLGLAAAVMIAGSASAPESKRPLQPTHYCPGLYP